jgi:hypothetical protein
MFCLYEMICWQRLLTARCSMCVCRRQGRIPEDKAKRGGCSGDMPLHTSALLCLMLRRNPKGISGIGRDTAFGGASAQGDFTVSWVAPGIPGRESGGGCARRVPQSPHVPTAENS